ncbi:tyrosine-type recombinase/integrase [Flavisolibacter nicotianae]|uniref:tyrosine-type recombinase/integrase n=1 Tax=Flavisolibacter nicotianae TaxID=2364882 RepID=UPI0013C4955E|nr:hypothetical protein [Flavisolibacter nicotianae]
MNEAKTLEERRAVTKALMELELNELKKLGFNPILEKHIAPFEQSHSIFPQTPFLEALRLAFAKAGFQGRTHTDIKSVLGYVEKASIQIGLDYVSISEIKPSHMLLLLEQCGKIKDRWTANTYNVYIKYLSILFGQLLQHQAVEFNPVRDLKKKKTIKNIRPVLSLEECARVDQFTKAYDERLWRFVHIFFHSGSRTTEILKVKGEHVDLKRQKVRYLVLKGKNYEWVERTIKDIAVPFWQAAMEGCSKGDYVFSKGLQPGASSIRAEQISRRWRKHIKGKLGIDCDFYSLKHLNTDQTAALLDLKTASAHNSHKSTKTTLTYAVNERERVHQKLKEVNNSFAD